jgi:hypothetical protein
VTESVPPESGEVAAPVARRFTGSRGRWAFASVVIVLAVIVLVSVLDYEYSPGGPENPFLVKVSQVVWTIGHSPFSSAPGFDKHAGKSAQTGVGLTCYPTLQNGFFSSYYVAQTCTSGSVFVETPGFSLEATNAPFTWSSGTSSGGTSQQVTVTVGVPSHSYTGNLTLELA